MKFIDVQTTLAGTVTPYLSVADMSPIDTLTGTFLVSANPRQDNGTMVSQYPGMGAAPTTFTTTSSLLESQRALEYRDVNTAWVSNGFFQVPASDKNNNENNGIRIDETNKLDGSDSFDSSNGFGTFTQTNLLYLLIDFARNHPVAFTVAVTTIVFLICAFSHIGQVTINEMHCERGSKCVQNNKIVNSNNLNFPPIQLGN